MKRIWQLAAAVLAVVLVVACGIELAEKSSGAVDPPNVVREHKFLSNSAAPKGGTWTDCSVSGSDSCTSGICTHVGLGIHEGYVCSAFCDEDKSPCPADFNCQPAYPGSANHLCIPIRNISPTPRHKDTPPDLVVTESAADEARRLALVAMVPDAGTLQ